MLKVYKNKNGTCSLVFENIRRYPNIFSRIPAVINYYCTGEQLFIGAYKIDGINIRGLNYDSYASLVYEHFQAHGEYCAIRPLDNKSIKLFHSDLLAFRTEDKEKLYEILDKMLDLFLETVIFAPKINWNVFKSAYSEYMKTGAYDYVLRGFTDYVLAYVDSGDFMITFDPEKHPPEIVQQQLNKLLMLDDSAFE